MRTADRYFGTWAADRGLVALAAAECERQGVGPMRVVDLLDGWKWARDRAWEPYEFDNECFSPEDVRRLAGIVEPNNGGRYRVTPVTFRSGGTATHHMNVPMAVDRLCRRLPLSARSIDDRQVLAREWTRAFLSIHPFSDGNGRTAWVLYHWVNGSFQRPVALPEMGFGSADVPATA